MAESPNPVNGPASEGGSRSTPDRLQGRLETLVGRARWALWWERAWPLIWLPIAIVLVFLTATWLGLWLDATPVMRAVERRLSADERSQRTKDPARASPQEKEPSLA